MRAEQELGPSGSVLLASAAPSAAAGTRELEVATSPLVALNASEPGVKAQLRSMKEV